MDDETYFTFTGTGMPANSGYCYIRPVGDVPNNVRYLLFKGKMSYQTPRPDGQLSKGSTSQPFCRAEPTPEDYARETPQSLQDAGVPAVGRQPSEYSQLRPIEDYWGLLKQEVHR